MNRFIALLWNGLVGETNKDAAALVSGIERQRPLWRRRWDLPGAIVFEAPWRSRAEQGLELGKQALFIGAVFQGDRIARAADLDVQALVRSGGASACRDLWGRYVLITRAAAQARASVLRDPSGALPCFMAQRGRAYVFFSHSEDLEALELHPASRDWTYVAQRLWNNRVITSRTGLTGVRALAPGEIARVGQGARKIETAWSLSACARASDGDDATPAERLEQAVDRACRAWRGCFDAAGLRLSGGLDSSIVLGALPRERLKAINFATPSPEGDERDFARAAAAHAGVPLVEVARDPGRVDLQRAMRHQPMLNPQLADGETDQIEAAFARAEGLKAIFSGRGGDNVFYRSARPHVLADWAALNGVGPGFWRCCLAYAAQTERPAAQSALAALRMLGRAQPDAQPAHLELLSKRAREMALTEPKPQRAELPPGKLLHIEMIEDRLNYFDHRPHADYIYPLVSQPVLEACLAIPTFVLSPGGLDRGLARAVFARRLAPEIRNRRSKGQTGAYLNAILLRHLPFVRDVLLHGALASFGLVAPDPLRRALSEEGLMRKPRLMPALVGLLSVDAWLRRPPPQVRESAP